MGDQFQLTMISHYLSLLKHYEIRLTLHESWPIILFISLRFFFSFFFWKQGSFWMAQVIASTLIRRLWAGWSYIASALECIFFHSAKCRQGADETFVCQEEKGIGKKVVISNTEGGRKPRMTMIKSIGGLSFLFAPQYNLHVITLIIKGNWAHLDFVGHFETTWGSW